MLRIFCLLPCCLLAGFGTPSLAQTAQIAELQEQLLAAQSGLAILESDLDRHDPHLLETLEQLADRYISLQMFDAAHVVLDRACQITRLAEGLYTPLQIPLQQKKITNYADNGNWHSASASAEHLLWLLREKFPLNPTLVEQLMTLTHFHLRGVAENQEQEIFHLRQALEANRLALLAAERVWGKHDPRLVPVIYSMLKQHHLQTVAIDRGGDTGYALRELVPGSRWVFDRETMQRTHYAIGLRLLQRIQTIYSTAEPPNAEAMAMTGLYTADWHVLYSRRQQALGSYQNAHDGLLAAGVSATRINRFLNVPAVLPVIEFFDSLESAVDTRIASANGAGSASDQFSELTLQYNEWSASFPTVQSPVKDYSNLNSDSEVVLLTFNLAGLNEVRRWNSGRYQTGIGMVKEARLINTPADWAADSSGVFGRLHSLRFRPRLINGVPAAVSGTLKYVVAN